MEPKYPEVTVTLVGENSNAFSVIAKVRREMWDAGIEKEIFHQYIDEAMSGDYDHLLQTTMKYVNVE